MTLKLSISSVSTDDFGGKVAVLLAEINSAGSTELLFIFVIISLYSFMGIVVMGLGNVTCMVSETDNFMITFVK